MPLGWARMQLTVTWQPDQEREMDYDMVVIERAIGFQASDLVDLQRDAPRSRVSVPTGSIGKGAAGSGVALVLEIAEHVLTDAASAIAVGEVLRRVVKRVSARRNSGPSVVSPDGLAALAADHARNSLPTDARYVKTVLLNGDVGMGTDERDVLAV